MGQMQSWPQQGAENFGLSLADKKENDLSS
jgi:hypothetical protein